MQFNEENFEMLSYGQKQKQDLKGSTHTQRENTQSRHKPMSNAWAYTSAKLLLSSPHYRNGTEGKEHGRLGSQESQISKLKRGAKVLHKADQGNESPQLLGQTQGAGALLTAEEKRQVLEGQALPNPASFALQPYTTERSCCKCT